MIYLDNAATTMKKPQKVLKMMQYAYENCSGAGRGGHTFAMNAADVLLTARERAAKLFGADSPEQIVFTGNATHSLNTAINGMPNRTGNCVISGYEHNSVLRPVMAMHEIECRVASGRLFDPDDMVRQFKHLIDGETSFVVCTHMSNVFGYILPVERIDALCAERGIPLIIDASQSAGSVGIKLNKLKAAVCICAPGHKGLYGPQGTGILVCRNGEELAPLMYGGTGSVSGSFLQPDFMPDRLESGTHNIPGIAGLSEGISYILEKGTDRILRHERELVYLFVEEAKKMNGLKLFLSEAPTLQGGVVSFVSERMSPEKIASVLNEEKIAVRSGLHCSPLAHETVGTRQGAVRVSVSDFTEEKEVLSLLKALRKTL